MDKALEQLKELDDKEAQIIKTNLMLLRGMVVIFRKYSDAVKKLL